jgi:hypothetical protein
LTTTPPFVVAGSDKKTSRLIRKQHTGIGVFVTTVDQRKACAEILSQLGWNHAFEQRSLVVGTPATESTLLRQPEYGNMILGQTPRRNISRWRFFATATRSCAENPSDPRRKSLSSPESLWKRVRTVFRPMSINHGAGY